MLFYYTATGNSLYVSRQLDSNPLSIPQELKKENLSYSDNIIGIVAPVYAGELPKTVRKFIERAKFNADYFYMILTYGSNDSVAGVWCKSFGEKNGLNIDYIGTIEMVDNYLPVFDMKEQTSIDKHIDEQIQLIKENLKNRKKFIPEPTEEGKQAYASVSKLFSEHPEFNNGEAIIMTERCVGCRICEQVCPIGNIKVENNRAYRINKTCDFCLACVHNCPFNSIDLINEKNPNERYRHPAIALKDIVESNHQGGER